MARDRRKPATKRASKNAPAKRSPQLVRQPHGGALLDGGIPGHPGAGGRPPSKLRESYRELIAETGVHLVRQILLGDVKETSLACPECHATIAVPISPVAPNLDQQLKALDAANRYGLGTTKELHLSGVEGVAEAFNIIRTTIREQLKPTEAESLLAAIDEALPS